MGINDYSDTEHLNTTIPGSPTIDFANGPLRSHVNKDHRKAFQRIMADLKSFQTSFGKYYTNAFNPGTGDQTATVQAALDAVDAFESDGGYGVVVNRGTKFDLSALTFPKRGFLEFISDDDTHQNPLTERASGEIVRMVFGANDAGIVNEQVFQSPYGNGLILNVQKDIDGQDAYLGPNHTPSVQGRIPGTYYTSEGTDDPVSISAKNFLIMESERVSTFGIISEEFGPATKSEYDGIKLHAYRRRMTLTVDDTTGFLSTVGARIEGLTSGFFGYLVSLTSTTVTLDWQYGQPSIGEELYDYATSARPVVASHSMATDLGRHLWFGQSNGAISLGVPPGRAITDYTMGGRLLLHPTFNISGVHGVEDVTDPALVFNRDIVSAPSVGRQIALNSDGNLVARLTTAAGATDRGHIGQLVAAGRVSDNGTAAGASAGSFGATAARSATTGKYEITFDATQDGADYFAIVASNTHTLRIIIDDADRAADKFSYTLYGYNDTTAVHTAHSATFHVIGYGA